MTKLPEDKEVSGIQAIIQAIIGVFAWIILIFVGYWIYKNVNMAQTFNVPEFNMAMKDIGIWLEKPIADLKMWQLIAIVWFTSLVAR